jgi:hypothetical protein
MTLILLVFAFVFFVIAACVPWVPIDPYRLRLVALGLAFWVLTSILAGGEAFFHTHP